MSKTAKRLRILLLGCIVALSLVGAGVGVFYAHLGAPVGGSKTSLVVAKGATLRPVLNDLANQGVSLRPSWVYLYARLADKTAIRVGIYDVMPEQSPRELIAMLEKGVVATATFTIPEGLNRWQVRDLLAADGWVSAEQFDALCDDANFLTSHGIVGPACEGFLFPETYTFARGVPAKKLIGHLFDTYRRHMDEATAESKGPMDFSELQLITLASIVEKETSVEAERPRIACVFYNRMQAKPAWPLQTDPTVIYAATLNDPNFDGNIKTYHLRTMKHPYNTYSTRGLPPGPIASPGRAAMDAVVAPVACKDFFFVSKNNGHHLFCPTLDCHEAGVDRYQRSLRRTAAP